MGLSREQIDRATDDRFDVMSAGESLATYYRFAWGPWDDGQPTAPVPARLTVDASIEGVVADIVAHYHDDFPASHAGPEDPHRGFGGKDLAIWQGNQLLAMILYDEDGEPVSTITRGIGREDSE